MRFKCIINSIIITAVTVLLFTLAFHIKSGVTADSIVIMKTTGMTCGSCSSKISTTLEKQKGVAASEVDVEGGRVIVAYDTKTVRPEILAEKVSGVGFRSKVYQLLTPEQFKQITGREIAASAAQNKICCGRNGGSSDSSNRTKKMEIIISPF